MPISRVEISQNTRKKSREEGKKNGSMPAHTEGTEWRKNLKSSLRETQATLTAEFRHSLELPPPTQRLTPKGDVEDIEMLRKWH